MPYRVDGVTIPNDDGSFDIYVNANHSFARQQIEIEHELRHIRNDHFYAEESVGALEADARNCGESIMNICRTLIINERGGAV